MTNQDNNTGNRWETCPSCGKKNRWPSHPLCSHCNKQYNEEATEKAANLDFFPNRVRWAHQKGVRILFQMEQEHREVAEVTLPVLQRAGREIQKSLGRRIDPKVFRDARLKRYWKLLEDGSPEVMEAAKRERQLFAAVCSLKSFLEDVEAREEAEQPAIEEEAD